MKNPKVVIDKLSQNPVDFHLQLQTAAEILGLNDDVKMAKAVFIKPNLTYPVYKEGVTTRVEFVRDLVSLLKELNPELSIYIGEAEGGYNSFSMSAAMEGMGFNQLSREFSSIKIVNLSQIPCQTITITTNKGLFTIELPDIFFNEIDFSISCPLPKIHAMTKVSLSFKNQWGCLPDVMRLKNHYMFDHVISKISEKLKFKYTFLDGRFGLNNNGPMVGDAVEVNWFAASNSLGAFDMVLAEMMGFKWEKIKHLKYAAKEGLLPERKHVDIIGNVDLLKKEFILRRNIWAYPALFAFRSRLLTHLFYFSKLAKPLHDFMYLFRKKPTSN